MSSSSALSPEAQADALLLHYLSPRDDRRESVWTESYAANVRERRAHALKGQLFMDRLLADAGIEGTC